MCKYSYKRKVYHGKHLLFTLTVFSYGLYANLQRTTGFLIYSCALAPLKTLSHQFKATICNCTNNVEIQATMCSFTNLLKMYHEKHSLFTLTVYSYGLYSKLQRKTGFLFYSCALVPLTMLSNQLKTTMCNCTNKLEMFHGKHSSFTLTAFSYGLHANIKGTTGFLIYSCALVPLKLFSHQPQATMCNSTNEVKMYHGQCSLFTLTIFSYG